MLHRTSASSPLDHQQESSALVTGTWQLQPAVTRQSREGNAYLWESNISSLFTEALSRLCQKSFFHSRQKLLWHCKEMNDRTGQHKSTSASLPVCRCLDHISESVNSQEILVWLSQVHKMNDYISSLGFCCAGSKNCISAWSSVSIFHPAGYTIFKGVRSSNPVIARETHVCRR